ncbi:MAG: acyl carrier protein [Clostridiales bacterium]|nr:acyl carrier protein [Clostridiales bacterium]
MANEVFEKVVEIIVENLSCEPEEVTPQAKVMEDLGADSLNVVEITMAMEDAFGIEIADEDFNKLETVQDIVDYIKAKL